MPFECQVGFIGAGMMASALMGGLDAAGTVPFKAMGAFDTWAPARDKAAALGARAFTTAAELVANSRVVVLAVKPNVVPAVLRDVANKVTPEHLIVSVAAGVPLSQIEAELSNGTRVVRVMPNTPCMVGVGACGYSRGTDATDEDMKYVGSLLEALGVAVEVPEKDLHAVTGVSGSGPAYVFMFIEALADGGVRQGLPRDKALKLAAQTVKGAAEMVLSTGNHPGVLKDQVCSPGGTTIAAVEALEQNSFRAAAMAAVSAATTKSKALAEPQPKSRV